MTYATALAYAASPQEYIPVYDRVVATVPEDIIAYYRANELDGTTAIDSSAEENDGSYSGSVTLNSGKSVDNLPCPLFTAGHINIYSAGFDADFNKTEGTILAWVNLNTVPIAVGSVVIYIGGVTNPGNDLTRIYLSFNGVSQIVRFVHSVFTGGVESVKQASFDWPGINRWLGLAVTWSETNDEIKIYSEGELKAITSLDGQKWVDDPLSIIGCTIAAERITNANPFKGLMSDIVIWKSALSDSAAAALTR